VTGWYTTAGSAQQAQTGTPAGTARGSTDLSPVRDTDDPDLVIPADRGLLWNEFPVTGHNHLKGICPNLMQERPDGSRTPLYYPDTLIRQNDFHFR